MLHSLGICTVLTVAAIGSGEINKEGSSSVISEPSEAGFVEAIDKTSGAAMVDIL